MKEPEKKRGLFGRLFSGARPDHEPDRAPEHDHEAAATAPPVESPEPAGSGEAAAPVNSTETLAPAGQAADAEPVRGSWFQRLRSGLAKTSNRLTEGISSVFTKRRLDDDTLEDLEDLLIQADLGLETTERITAALRSTRYDKAISPEEVREVLAAEVEQVLQPVAMPLEISRKHKPEVVVFVGVNGTGKTTTIGKLAARFRREGLSVMMAAGDTFRAAAIEQLKVWGERTGAPVVAKDVGADAAGLAYEALEEAQRCGTDVLLVDTAGRLQNKKALMEELEKVIRVIRKLDPSAPHQVILVLDATTGQNAMSQVEVFEKVAGVTGLVMTKLDGTARGGILVAISAKFKLPVVALGVGERIDDLQSFDAREFARAIAQV